MLSEEYKPDRDLRLSTHVWTLCDHRKEQLIVSRDWEISGAHARNSYFQWRVVPNDI